MGNPGVHPMQQRMNFIPPQWGYVDPNHFFNQHQFNKVRNINQGQNIDIFISPVTRGIALWRNILPSFTCYLNKAITFVSVL